MSVNLNEIISEKKDPLLETFKQSYNIGFHKKEVLMKNINKIIKNGRSLI